MIYPQRPGFVGIYGLFTMPDVLERKQAERCVNTDPALTINAIWSSK